MLLSKDLVVGTGFLHQALLISYTDHPSTLACPRKILISLLNNSKKFRELVTMSQDLHVSGGKVVADFTDPLYSQYSKGNNLVTEGHL